MSPNRNQPPAAPADPAPDPRPRYEPPRITKRRSVMRATLFSGANAQGPSAIGVAVNSPADDG
jgi:hypothetical protein